MATERISVSVEVECRPSGSPWQDHVWRVVALRPVAPGLADWTPLTPGSTGDRYHAGTAELVLYSSETKFYRDNLGSAAPSIYVVLRRARTASGLMLYCVTANPFEAHAHADVGDDLVEAMPMPRPLFAWVALFVRRHHVERPQWKRKRDRIVPGARRAAPAAAHARERR